MLEAAPDCCFATHSIRAQTGLGRKSGGNQNHGHCDFDKPTWPQRYRAGTSARWHHQILLDCGRQACPPHPKATPSRRAASAAPYPTPVQNASIDHPRAISALLRCILLSPASVWGYLHWRLFTARENLYKRRGFGRGQQHRHQSLKLAPPSPGVMAEAARPLPWRTTGSRYLSGTGPQPAFSTRLQALSFARP